MAWSAHAEIEDADWLPRVPLDEVPQQAGRRDRQSAPSTLCVGPVAGRRPITTFLKTWSRHSSGAPSSAASLSPHTCGTSSPRRQADPRSTRSWRASPAAHRSTPAATSSGRSGRTAAGDGGRGLLHHPAAVRRRRRRAAPPATGAHGSTPLTVAPHVARGVPPAGTQTQADSGFWSSSGDAHCSNADAVAPRAASRAVPDDRPPRRPRVLRVRST